MAALASVASLKKHFRGLKDPRVTGRSWHLLIDLVTMASCGVAEPAAPALPAQVAANAQALLAAYDADQDGALSTSEGAKLGLVGDAFAAADADHDGRLARPEFLDPVRLHGLESAFRAIAAQWLTLSDADGDGRVSRAEYDDALLQPRRGLTAGDAGDLRPAAFVAADADKDGALAAGEALGLVGWLLERGWRLAPRG